LEILADATGAVVPEGEALVVALPSLGRSESRVAVVAAALGVRPEIEGAAAVAAEVEIASEEEAAAASRSMA